MRQIKGLREGFSDVRQGKDLADLASDSQRTISQIYRTVKTIVSTSASHALRTRVKEEGSPVKGSAVVTRRMDEGELGIAQRGSGILARTEVLVKFVHQLGRGSVADFPKAGDDMVSAGAKEGPGQADQTFACIGLGASTVAGRNGDEVSGNRMLQDFAGI